MITYNTLNTITTILNMTTLRERFDQYAKLRLNVYRELARNDQWINVAEYMIENVVEYLRLKDVITSEWIKATKKLPTKSLRCNLFLYTVADLVSHEEFAKLCNELGYERTASEIMSPEKATLYDEIVTERTTTDERLDAFLARKPGVLDDHVDHLCANWKVLCANLAKQEQLRFIIDVEWIHDIEINAEILFHQGKLFLERISKIASVKEFIDGTKNAGYENVVNTLNAALAQ